MLTRQSSTSHAAHDMREAQAYREQIMANARILYGSDTEYDIITTSASEKHFKAVLVHRNAACSDTVQAKYGRLLEPIVIVNGEKSRLTAMDALLRHLEKSLSEKWDYKLNDRDHSQVHERSLRTTEELDALIPKERVRLLGIE